MTLVRGAGCACVRVSACVCVSACLMVGVVTAVADSALGPLVGQRVCLWESGLEDHSLYVPDGEMCICAKRPVRDCLLTGQSALRQRGYAGVCVRESCGFNLIPESQTNKAGPLQI